jgi:hypothetical protein
MPEYAEEQTKPTNGNQQPEQHPSQPLEVQPDGTWILGRGADRWMPTKYQIGDMRWLGLRIEDRLKGQNPEGIPGVESAKSIFFGVELGEGVADNRPVMPPSEPPRKSSQSEVLVVPKDVEHHAGR